MSGKKKVELTVDGITVHVWPDAFDDIEMLEYLVGIDNNEYAASVAALKKLFGEEYEQVKAALRDERGVVSSKRIGKIFFSICAQLSKNSRSS